MPRYRRNSRTGTRANILDGERWLWEFGTKPYYAIRRTNPVRRVCAVSIRRVPELRRSRGTDYLAAPKRNEKARASGCAPALRDAAPVPGPKRFCVVE